MPALKTYLVEDSPVIRSSLISALEELSPVQVVGWSGDQAGALHWLADPAHEAALLIIDLFLKCGTGLGVLSAALPMRPALHCVVLSNYATSEVRSRCLQLGAERVFDKSVDIEALLGYCRGLAQPAH
jgi:DNA-binding NarL/FixJ family response regulator